ncbi:MAG: MATE family efflux transporter [Acidobacteriota bacterium]|nr:MATE family efflux transporter [Acidobacteriota bacterium]
MENSQSASTALPGVRSSFWGDLRDAVMGREHDYTKGNVNRAIILLAIPMILEMIMEAIFGIVDIYFVARLGKEAVATVALTETVMTMLFAIGLGLSMATTAMVARRVGEGNIEDARIAAAQSLVLGALVSIPITLLGIFYGAAIFRAMGAEPEVIAVGSMNVTVMLAGNATLLLLFLGNAIFRGAGNPAMSMYVLAVCNGLNIILDPCFIFGWGPFPELGVTGAAVATNIGRGIGVVMQFVLLMRGMGAIHLKLHHFRPRWDLLRRIVRISVGGIIQWTIATTSWVIIVRFVASFGSAAVAGYGVALRIIVFTILPAWGLSNAAATLVGQNLGAGRPDRAESSVWRCGFYNMIFLSLIMVGFLIYAEELVGLLTSEAEVLVHGAHCLRVVSYGYVFYGWGMVLTHSFNGSGDTWTPTLINFLCYWVIQIPLAGVLSLYLDWGTHGVYIAIAISESVLAVIGAWFFKLGKWKKREI